MFQKNKEITCSCIIPELDLYLYCILNTSTDKKLKENNMHSWFECKVSFEKVLENGMQKKVTEPYLVDALSFTEAEARIIEEIRPFISGEFTVTDIKRARLSELFFNENGDRFYKIKVYFITLDERSHRRTGRRHERHHGRLHNRFGYRNHADGRIPFLRQ